MVFQKLSLKDIALENIGIIFPLINFKNKSRLQNIPESNESSRWMNVLTRLKLDDSSVER